MNQVYLIGYVSFPKISQTTQGKQKCTCNIGVPKKKSAPGDATQYENIRVTAYGDDIVNLVDKARVFVQGKLSSYSFQDQQTGQQVKITEVTASLVLEAPNQQPQQNYQQFPQQNRQFPPQGYAKQDPFNAPNPGGQNNMFPPSAPMGGMNPQW